MQFHPSSFDSFSVFLVRGMRWNAPNGVKIHVRCWWNMIRWKGMTWLHLREYYPIHVYPIHSVNSYGPLMSSSLISLQDRPWGSPRLFHLLMQQKYNLSFFFSQWIWCLFYFVVCGDEWMPCHSFSMDGELPPHKSNLEKKTSASGLVGVHPIWLWQTSDVVD
jgi:hypothetical protein